MPIKSVLEAVHDALAEEMRADERVFMIGEDIGAQGGVFLTTAGLQAEFGEERVIDSPLAETAIVGLSIGAAFNGMRPVVEIQFFDFILPAMEQIVDEAAKIRWRSNNRWSCPIVIRTPTGAGVRGGLYHPHILAAVSA